MKYRCPKCDFRTVRKERLEPHINKCHKTNNIMLPDIFYNINVLAFNYIFIHIPKNAGTTINKVLKNSEGSNIILNIKEINDNDVNYVNSSFHNTLNFCHFPFKMYNVPNKTIAFTRNPYSRVVSLFFFQKLHKKYTFKEFIIKIYKNKKLVKYIKNDDYDDNITFDLIKFPYSWKNQSFWIPKQPFFIGKFSNLKEDLEKLYENMNLKIKKDDFPHRKKTQHDYYKNYYDQETIHIIEDLYSDDLKQFNYSF